MIRADWIQCSSLSLHPHPRDGGLWVSLPIAFLSGGIATVPARFGEEAEIVCETKFRTRFIFFCTKFRTPSPNIPIHRGAAFPGSGGDVRDAHPAFGGGHSVCQETFAASGSERHSRAISRSWCEDVAVPAESVRQRSRAVLLLYGTAAHRAGFRENSSPENGGRVFSRREVSPITGRSAETLNVRGESARSR